MRIPIGSLRVGECVAEECVGRDYTVVALEIQSDLPADAPDKA
jgi:hypothetical protein